MPLMISLPSISRLALAAALVLPAVSPAFAQSSELTPEQMAWYRAQMGLANTSASPPMAPSSVGDAVMEWRRLTANSGASFDQLSRFLIANKGWPNGETLRARAESAISIDSFDPARTLAFFDAYPPQSASGQLRHALALNATGRRDEAHAAVRRAWTGGTLNEAEISRVLAIFPGALSAADHDSRMDRLLWSGATSAATRQLSLTSPDKRPVFAARLAMRGNAVDAAMQSAAVEAADPSLTRSDAGYITDKATWLRRSGRSGSAQALLSGPRELKAPPTDTVEWLKTLLVNARQAQSEGNRQVAYNIASRLDDAVAPGTVLRNTSFGTRDAYTDLAWLAAQVAEKDLRRPADAARLYRAYGDAAQSAQTQAKGYYWAGRAALAAGDTAGANRHFEAAGKYYDQFYGQLSLERLGRPQPRPASAPPQVTITAAERDAFENDRLVRATKALGEIGAWREQSLFVRALANRASSSADHILTGQISSRIGRPDLGVWTGRNALAKDVDAVHSSGFPTVRVPAGHENNWTFIHAIIRQESQFNREAISPVGARGMMQLMPGTASDVSRRLGLSYDASALTTDTNYNMTLGSSYFQQRLSDYRGSYPLALAAYNAGAGNVNKWLRSNGDPRNGGIDWIEWIEAIPFSETRGYVMSVLANAVVYDTLHPTPDRSLPAAPLSFYMGKRTPG